jgi:signal transduction histidine kinase
MKLLHRTVRGYIIYACLLLLIAIPAFYLVLSRLVQREIDQVLLSHKRDFIKSAANFTSLDDIRHYPLLNEEFFITPVTVLATEDSFYTEHIRTPYEPKPVPVRVVRTGLYIQGQPYELLVKESLLESEDLIKAIIYTQTALIVILLGGLILINRQQSKKIWHPFNDTLQKLKAYEIHQHQKIDLQPSDIIEFEDLRKVVQQLLLKNQQAYQYQKEFTENASHEIQTPLAVIASRLDLLMQTEPLTTEQGNIITEASDATHQLSRLNKNLLLLTKIEHKQFQGTANLQLLPMVEKAIHQLQDLAEEKDITFTIDHTPLALVANAAQMEILLSNLLGNAVKHASGNSVIHVSLADSALTISNAGAPLLQAEKIFERFQRDTGNAAGSGLGLSIVARICDLNGYAVRYAYTDGRHIFRIRFAPQLSA